MQPQSPLAHPRHRYQPINIRSKTSFQVFKRYLTFFLWKETLILLRGFFCKIATWDRCCSFLCRLNYCLIGEVRSRLCGIWCFSKLFSFLLFTFSKFIVKWSAEAVPGSSRHSTSRCVFRTNAVQPRSALLGYTIQRKWTCEININIKQERN